MTRIELVERLDRTYQRLQEFQERHAAQLSHSDRQWLHRALHEVARYHAELSSPWRTGSTVPERQGIAPRWQKAVQSARQRPARLVWTTLQQEWDTARAVRSMARAARPRRLRQGLLSICAFCQQILAERGTWQRLEAYMQTHFEVQFAHDFCPRCTQRHYGITLPGEADGGERHQRNQRKAARSRALRGMPNAGGPYDRMDPSTAGAVAGPGISHSAGVRPPNTNVLRIHPATWREDGPPPASRRKG
jgi:hypothetical protein